MCLNRYLLFHQLHRDFLNGRLIAPHEDLIRLAAFFIQGIFVSFSSETVISVPCYCIEHNALDPVARSNTYYV